VVVLATSNGTGMGHLSRQLAVGQALGAQASPVYFSLSRAVRVIEHDGRRGEYCPSRERGWLPTVQWQEYLRQRLRAFVEETGATTVVFDGVVPYNGLLLARAELRGVRFVWMRRGYWRAAARTAPLRSSGLFDLVLEPGDFAADGDRGPTSVLSDAVRLPPISQLEHLTPLPRAEAAAKLGLDPDRPTVLVTLAAGVVNDVATPGAVAVEALLADPEWQVAVVRSALARDGIPLGDPARCVELRGVYPLAQYLLAFDAAVAAGGYNSVHELLTAGVPTLFVPNPTAGTDDQQARTRWLADHGYARYAEAADLDEVAAQARGLHDAAERKSLREACAVLPAPSGSAAAAGQILELQHRSAKPPGGRATASLRAKAAATRALGPRGAALARKALGRPAVSGPTAPLPVRVVSGKSSYNAPSHSRPLLFTESLEGVLDAQHPVEHLLPGCSEAYRRRRIEIARRFYDLREV